MKENKTIKQFFKELNSTTFKLPNSIELGTIIFIVITISTCVLSKFYNLVEQKNIIEIEFKESQEKLSNCENLKDHCLLKNDLKTNDDLRREGMESLLSILPSTDRNDILECIKKCNEN